MSRVVPGRRAVDIEPPFAVFLIGMRVNRPLQVGAWWPVFSAMAPMLRELYTNPELGMLASRFLMPITLVQYWRSFEHLEAYARAKDHAHLPAWRAFNQRARSAGGAVGIWHETYVVEPGGYEAVYLNMPPTGLGKAGTLVEAAGARATARGRLAASRGKVSDAPAAVDAPTPPTA